ncbi:MAG: hypothetical protein ABJ000_00740 [Saccharospirillum sp.]|uniref:hypothetical protein n=1 Tax=Saccharospirillum sp. TaxID=2033801 RepID=UPI0032980F65
MGILWVSVVIQAGWVGTGMARQYGTVSTGVELAARGDGDFWGFWLGVIRVTLVQ